MKKSYFLALSGLMVFLFFGLAADKVQADTPTVTVQLISPADNAIVSSAPTFSWKSVGGANWYEVEIEGFSLIRSQDTTLSPGDYTWYWPEFKTVIPYKWRVRWSADQQLWGDNWSAFRTFSLKGTVPAVPTDRSPCNGAKTSLTPTLSWKDVKADFYELQIQGFQVSQVFTNSQKISKELSPDYQLRSGQTYSWSVKACNNAGCSQPSAVCKFVVEDGSASGGTGSGGSSGSSGSGGGSACQIGEICNPLKYSNFEDLINAIIDFLIKISIPIATIMFVVSGIMFVTSAGDPAKAKTARQVAVYTAIGFAVILVASGLIKVLQSLLGG